MRKNILILSLLIISAQSWAECKIGDLEIDPSVSQTPEGTPNPSNYITITGQKVLTKALANINIGTLIKTKTDTNIAQSNVVAFEYIFKKPINLNSNELASGFITGTSNYDGIVFAAPSFGSAYGSQQNLFMSSISGNITPNQTQKEVLANETVRVGIYYNQISKKIGYIVNGVDRGYTWSYTTPLSKMKFAIAIEEGFYASNSSALGKEISYEIVSDHSKLQFTYPTGTTDICGTPL